MIDLLLLVVAIGAMTKRVNTGNTIGRVASVRSQLYLSGCETWRSRLHCWPHSALRTTADRMAEHRKSDQRRDDPYGARLRKRAMKARTVGSSDWLGVILLYQRS